MKRIHGKQKSTQKQNFETFGVTHFAGLNFKQSSTFTLKHKDLIVKTSSIPNAGLGVFATTKLIGGPNGQYLMSYDGEPLLPWMYNALDMKDHVYTGIDFQFPPPPPPPLLKKKKKNKDVPLIIQGVFRGILGTMGPRFNSAMKKSQANVEFLVDYSKVDFKNKIFHGYNFIQIWIKPRVIIPAGTELFLYYSANFWKRFVESQNEIRNQYCCICLSYHSLPKSGDPMLLCDVCFMGFHVLCLKQVFNIPIHSLDKYIHDKKLPWYCPNCHRLSPAKRRSMSVK